MDKNKKMAAPLRVVVGVFELIGLAFTILLRSMGIPFFPQSQTLQRQPIDKHEKVVATIHIVWGVLASLLVVVVALFVSYIGPRSGGSLSSFFSLVIICVLLSIVQIIAGISCRRGPSKAKYILIAYSVPMLFFFPIGTGLSAYTLWAFLRRRAVPAQNKDEPQTT